MRLSTCQVDRACGAVLASAAGDALGAGYEFGAATYPGWPAMIGGGLGGFAPGEWTDDTAQAFAILEVAASRADLRTDEALDAIAANFAEWYAGNPPDVGVQTSQVLSLAGPDARAVQMTAAARTVHERTGRSAGNGSLMRTAPVALSHLENPAALVQAAMGISALTHHDDLAQQGAALWCLMLRHAILEGDLPAADDVVRHLPDPDRWRAILAAAEEAEPGEFFENGWVVGALQAAWSAITHTPVPDEMPCRHLQLALARAIEIGNDTDTVAAIAGALLGARWGASAVPLGWTATLHGWRDQTGQGLVDLATLASGRRRRGSWPDVDRIDYRHEDDDRAFVQHPLVERVWIGGAMALDDLPQEIDAVVSLCRTGRRQVPDGVERYAVRLIDSTSEDNPNVEFVIDEAARMVLRLRDEGKRVYLHCVAAHSRTPTVAARVAVLAGTPLETALSTVTSALPHARPRGFFVAALRRLSEADARD